MKICVAQAKPIKGDITRNIEGHERLIELSVSAGAEAIFFPELSLTGYEPALAKELAMDVNDSRLDVFQQISNKNKLVIGVGIPVRYMAGICITMMIFQPHRDRQTYSKSYLHPDEEPFFISGEGISLLKVGTAKIALAICYELSVDDHAENAFRNGAQIYIASVAKFVRGVDKAITRLSEISKKYAMTALMSNCIGTCDGEECAGKSSVWNNKGMLLGQLNEVNEGILVLDTESQEVIKRSL